MFTTAIKFEIFAQSHKDGQFVVPVDVVKELGLADGNFVRLRLTVLNQNETEVLFSGEKELKLGTEVYGLDLKKTKAGQSIIVYFSPSVKEMR